VSLELAQVVAELVEAVSFIGEMEAGGGPPAFPFPERCNAIASVGANSSFSIIKDVSVRGPPNAFVGNLADDAADALDVPDSDPLDPVGLLGLTLARGGGARWSAGDGFAKVPGIRC
jgi:hypothetical protein